MLIKCPECETDISEKAISCPKCGFPLTKSSSKRTVSRKKRMKLPNGFGQIQEIKGRNLRKPFRAKVTTGVNEFGRPITVNLKPVAYFETYNDAYAALIKYHENPYDFSSKTVTVEELYMKWSAEYFKTVSDSSRRSIVAGWAYCSSIYRMNVKEIRVRHFKRVFEEGCITDPKNPSEVKYLSPTMKKVLKSMFNIMFDYAVEYEIIDRNYARDFRLSKDVSQEIEIARKEHIIFTEEEMNTLWDNLYKVPNVDIILFQCYTGMRPQEIGLIEVSSVNITEKYFRGGIKTRAGKNRLIPIHSRIMSIVQRKYSEAITSGSDKLFGNLSYITYRRRYKKVIETLGLNLDHKAHDPRVQFVTTAKKSGVDENVIKLVVGHSISDITEKVYTKRDIEWILSEIEKIK